MGTYQQEVELSKEILQFASLLNILFIQSDEDEINSTFFSSSL